METARNTYSESKIASFPLISISEIKYGCCMAKVIPEMIILVPNWVLVIPETLVGFASR